MILGARTMEQLKDNLGAVGLHLSAEETTRLDAASDPGATGPSTPRSGWRPLPDVHRVLFRSSRQRDRRM